MFENLTNKQKIAFLIFTVIVLFLAANKRSYKVTLNAYSQVKELEEKLEYVKKNISNSQDLRRKSLVFNRILGSQENIGADEIQQNLLDFITAYPSIKVDFFRELHFFQLNDYDVITNQVVLEGSFSKLLEFVYELEKKFDYSIVVSVNFNKSFDYKRRKNKLKVEIILQNYEKRV